MTNDDKVQFAAIMRGLSEVYNKEISKQALALHFKVLEAFSIEEIQAAAVAILANRKFTSMPVPADFLEYLGGGSVEDQGMVQAGLVLQAIGRHGGYASVCFDDATTQAVIVQSYGGWGQMCAELDLRPVMKLKSQVGMVKVLPPGSGISYGHMYTTLRETKIATLPVGYADGYPRRLSNSALVLVGGRPAPVLGAVCMDQCMVDVTGLDVNPGDEAVLMGSQGDASVTADELADIAGTIGYELTCGVGKRVPRVYIRNNVLVKTLRMV